MDISMDISMDIHIHGKPAFERAHCYKRMCCDKYVRLSFLPSVTFVICTGGATKRGSG